MTSSRSETEAAVGAQVSYTPVQFLLIDCSVFNLPAV